MAVKTLENLVLRGVAVLRGGKAVELRLGTSVVAKEGTSEIHLPMPCHTAGCPINPSQETQFDPYVPSRHNTDERVLGAGRSRRTAGRFSTRDKRAWTRTTTAWRTSGLWSVLAAMRAGLPSHASSSKTVKSSPANNAGSSRLSGAPGFTPDLWRCWISGC